MSGLEPAARAAGRSGVELVPGVEISTLSGGTDVHILGYYCEPTMRLSALLERLRRAREERVARIVARLENLGLGVQLSRVRDLARGGALGRPHVARAMVERGYVASMAEAFERYLNPGCPAYVERYKLTPGEAVSEIRLAGGVPVLAHPGLIGDDQLIPGLVDQGLLGLEALYPEHTPEQARRYASLAGEMGLVITGGSDCHGPGGGRKAALGSVRVPYTTVADLQSAKRHVRRGHVQA